MWRKEVWGQEKDGKAVRWLFFSSAAVPILKSIVTTVGEGGEEFLGQRLEKGSLIILSQNTSSS